MNPFSLLFIPLPKALQIITRESNKIRVCSTYIEKMDLNIENPKVSKGKVHFNDIQRNVRHNLDLPLQEPHPNAPSDTESTISSKKMDIICEPPNIFGLNIDQYEFESVSLKSHSDESNGEIHELDRIPNHVRSIQEVLSNRQRLEYFITHNGETIIDIIKNY